MAKFGDDLQSDIRNYVAKKETSAAKQGHWAIVGQATITSLTDPVFVDNLDFPANC